MIQLEREKELERGSEKGGERKGDDLSCKSETIGAWIFSSKKKKKIQIPNRAKRICKVKGIWWFWDRL